VIAFDRRGVGLSDPAGGAPTLEQRMEDLRAVMHRRGDRAVNYRAARWLAEQIEGTRYLEFEGEDHLPWVGDSEPPLAAIEVRAGLHTG
jgi:pimeloyl-ACP methyl ester carboxylesterase